MLTIFGLAVALFEAIVDYYLRRITHSGSITSLPLVPRFPTNMLLIEQTREVAVIVLLASIAWLASGNRWGKLAAFTWIFAIWALFSRIFLFMAGELTRPKSAWMISIPAPMQSYAPVWIVIVATMLMLGCSLWMLRSKADGLSDTSSGPRVNYAVTLALLTVLAIAMAHLEGVVVVYIRAILLHYSPHMSGFHQFDAPSWLMSAERIREACTIVMIFAVSMLAGKSKWEKFAVFMWVFAFWDIFYYVSLKVCTGWPESLGTLDVLFLIPVVWVEPVWFPVLISILMIVIAFLIFRKENRTAY